MLPINLRCGIQKKCTKNDFVTQKCIQPEKKFQGLTPSEILQKVALGIWCDRFLIMELQLFRFQIYFNSRNATKVLNIKHFSRKRLSMFVISTFDKNGILLAKNLTGVLVHSLSLQIYLFQCLSDFSFSTNYTDVEFSLIW